MITTCKTHSLVKEHVVLGTHAETLAYLLHLGADVVAVDGGVPTGRGEQARQDRPTGRRHEVGRGDERGYQAW